MNIETMVMGLSLLAVNIYFTIRHRGESWSALRLITTFIAGMMFEFGLNSTPGRTSLWWHLVAAPIGLGLAWLIYYAGKKMHIKW
jgi:hypothetical protein